MTTQTKKLLVNLIIIFFISACSYDTQVVKKTDEPKGDYVVVLHGILTSNWHMQSIANFLAQHDYEVINIAYPSTKYDLKTLKDIITKDIKKHITADKPVHFIGFSMGGLLLRAVLKDYQPKHMGKVVHIATPNQGSELADKVKNCPAYKLFYGPAGQQLITDQSKFNKLFGKINYKLGIISGYHSYSLLARNIIPGDHDGRVSVKRTLLKGASDHIKINSMHSIMPYSKEVKKQILFFLQHGRFLKTKKNSVGLVNS